MNKQASELLQLGVIFGIIVVVVDLFFIPYPVLNWLALSVAFFFVSAIILDSVSRLVARQSRHATSAPSGTDELDYLTDVVERAIGSDQHESMEILRDKLKSIAVSTLAARTRESKDEVLELASRGLLGKTLKDEELLQLMSANHSAAGPLNYRRVNELLTRIEGMTY